MNREYIDWLESLPCNNRRKRVNTWMSEWAPLPKEIDLPRYQEWQDREYQRNPKGLMTLLKTMAVVGGWGVISDQFPQRRSSFK